MVTNSLAIVILVGTGLIIGFSFETGVIEIVGGFLLLLLFGFAFSWIFALIGMSVSSPEAANGIGSNSSAIAVPMIRWRVTMLCLSSKNARSPATIARTNRHPDTRSSCRCPAGHS